MAPLLPRLGDIVNLHAEIGGPVTSKGHRVRMIMHLPAEAPRVWISGRSGFVSMAAISSPEKEAQA